MIRKIISLLLVLTLATAFLSLDTAMLRAAPSGGGGEVDPTGLDTRNRTTVQRVERPVRDGATMSGKSVTDVREAARALQMFYLRVLLRSFGL